MRKEWCCYRSWITHFPSWTGYLINKFCVRNSQLLVKWKSNEQWSLFFSLFFSTLVFQSNLGCPNQNEALAVDGRQELDLKVKLKTKLEMRCFWNQVGVAFTRFQTRFFQGKYGNLDSALISYGPCQIPTLNFCVERYLRFALFWVCLLFCRYQLINEFQPEVYWTLSLSSVKGGIKVQWFWNRDRIFDQDIVLLFQSSVSCTLNR